jgi:hypothetical protein
MRRTPPWAAESVRRPSGADLGQLIFPLDTRSRYAGYSTPTEGAA